MSTVADIPARVDPESSGASAGRSPESLPDPRRRRELLQDCSELVVSRLSGVIGGALIKMSEDLSALALRSRQPLEQRALMDAVSIVRQHRAEIELRFRRSFADVYEQRSSDEPGAVRVAPAEPAELSLVDESEMHDRLATDRLVQRTRGTLDPDEVLGVRARIATLLQRDWFEEGQHPAAPEAVFEALKAAIADFAPRADVQAALLDAFEPHVSANLNRVYADINERLKASQVLPRIRPQVSQKTARRRSASPGAHPAAPASAGSPGSRAGGAAQGGPGAFEAQPAAGEFTLSQEGRASLSELSAGLPGARASATRVLSDPDIFAVADLPVSGADAPLLDSLSSLQAASGAVGALAPELRADLARRTRESGSALDQLTVEIVSMVFDYIYADKRLADVIKQQLLRLQVVAIKAALIDRSFFARRQHPMRRLIDRISDVAADPAADLAPGSALVTGVESVVESVLQGFEQDLSLFDAARARIEALAAQEHARSAERLLRITRAAERDDALLEAEQLARARLADRIGPATPAFLREFLQQWWGRVMADATVEGDETAFAERMASAESLMWSVAPKQPEEVGKLAALLPGLIGSVLRGVRRIDMPETVRQAFLDQLMAAHTAAIASAKQTAAGALARAAHAPAASPIPPVRSAQTTSAAPGVQTVSPAPALPAPAPAPAPALAQCRSLRLETLRRGDAIELLAANGQWLSYRLSWVSPQQRLYVLSRFPDEARSLERAQLAGLFDSDAARLGDLRGSVEQALDQLSGEPTAA